MTLLLHPAIPKIRRYIYRALALLDAVLPWGRQTVILAYHGIGSDQWRFGVSFVDFCTQMEHMLVSGFQPVTLDAIYAAAEKGEPLPRKSFAVTFDDGYKDILLVSHFLKKKGIRPTVFVLSDSERANREELGTGRLFLSTYEIRELHAAGWGIGCHSATHPDFSKLDATALTEEIIVAKKELEERIGFTIDYFAYPKGFHSELIRATVKSGGYRGALSMDDGFIGSWTDPYALPRIGVDQTHTTEEFPAIFLPLTIVFRSFVKMLLGRLQSFHRLMQERTKTSALDRIEKPEPEAN